MRSKKRKEKERSSWYKCAPSKKKRKFRRFLVILACILLLCGLGAFYMYKNIWSALPWEPFEITDENFVSYAPFDEKLSKKIDDMPSHSPDDTWAFYIYCIGSDLESRDMNELSYYTEYLISDEVAAIESDSALETHSRIEKFTEDVTSQGVDLPQILYMPTVKWSGGSDDYEDGSYDPDIKGFASTDMDEMMYADFSDNVRIVIQPGGAKRWLNSMINPNRTQRFTIDKDGISQVYDDVLSNMAAPETLSDFLGFCKENYPADHTALIFWNHGGGAFGYGSDEIFSDMMSITDVSEAIGSVFEPDVNDPPLEFIGFDACLMASAEVANELSGFAKYLAASEEVEPGDGWAYTDVLNALYDDPGMNPAKLCKVIADTAIRSNIEESAAEFGYLTPVTFSVMDLSKAKDVYDAYSRFCSDALAAAINDPSTLSVLSRCAQSSIAYAGSSYRVYNTIDLGIFMKEAVSADFLKSDAQAVLNALSDLVMYSRGTSYLSESEGVSVYFPARIEGISGINFLMEYIDTISKSKDISALYYYKLAGCLNEEFSDYIKDKGLGEVRVIDYSPMKKFSSASMECLGDGNLKLKLTDKQLSLSQSVSFGLVSYDPDTEDLLYLGEDLYAFLDPDGTISTDFDGTWIFLNEYPLPLEVVSQSGENITYRTPVIYNNMESYLMTCYNAETEEISVLGIREQMNEAGTLDRALLPIESGAYMMICYESGNLYSNASDTTHELVRIDGNMTLEEKPLNDGKYFEYILLEDIRSDTYSSQIASFDMDKGGIFNQAIEDGVYYYDKD